jgi:hypothetical protein
MTLVHGVTDVGNTRANGGIGSMEYGLYKVYVNNGMKSLIAKAKNDFVVIATSVDDAVAQIKENQQYNNDLYEIYAFPLIFWDYEVKITKRIIGDF